ncbi:ribonuclease H family protein [Lactobacillus sp. ESL0228]|uniref:ribonuclease H family protein n=1 Tax=Lactobacillus sp. ESL0228 TaxID=2069352 RepID=UPI000EFDB175|nr:ribonuclease H family protein [Lactobacillus sp. ESL0228]RMC51939.1 ribonuclease [Lactobacillus sp. ESL0228]
MKFYAVKKGRQPGVYRTWEAAKKQVDGYPNAEYKSFKQVTDATEYLNWDRATVNQFFQKDETSLKQAIAKIQNESQTISKISKQQSNPPQSKTAPRFSNLNKSSEYFATIYTDGGTRNTGNFKGGHVRATDKAAWAYLIEWQQEGKQMSTYDSNGEFGATNNKMELTALIEALKKLLELGFNKKPLLFVLDSQYVLNPIIKGWLKGWKKRGWRKSTPGEIANLECWQELDRLLAQFLQPKFEWTKGHANNRGNEFVDRTLNKFMDQM